jgi:hypothetical protein
LELVQQDLWDWLGRFVVASVFLQDFRLFQPVFLKIAAR